VRYFLKYIGEKIGQMEMMGEVERYICGFEESYGFLTGCYV
jgi:phosphoglucomutase